MKLNELLGELSDDSKMPDRGKWEGVKMANIDPSWLVWVYENEKCSDKVMDYVRAHYNDLLIEAKKGGRR